jgi:cytidylate kinase
MNIIEKYLEQKKQLIILISGFSGSGKTVFAKSLAKDLKINFENLNNYYLENYSAYKFIDGQKIIDWDSPNAIDWDKFNAKVNEIKNTGVVISGFAFPQKFLKFDVDFHIHLKITKDDLIKNRADFLAEREDSKLKDLDPGLEKKILNIMSFQHSMDSLKESKFDKFVNVEYGQLKKSYDEIFDYIVGVVPKKIN